MYESTKESIYEATLCKSIYENVVIIRTKCSIQLVKLCRAQGGCLGTESR